MVKASAVTGGLNPGFFYLGSRGTTLGHCLFSTSGLMLAVGLSKIYLT